MLSIGTVARTARVGERISVWLDGRTIEARVASPVTSSRVVVYRDEVTGIYFCHGGAVQNLARDLRVSRVRPNPKKKAIVYPFKTFILLNTTGIKTRVAGNNNKIDKIVTPRPDYIFTFTNTGEGKNDYFGFVVDENYEGLIAVDRGRVSFLLPAEDSVFGTIPYISSNFAGFNYLIRRERLNAFGTSSYSGSTVAMPFYDPARPSFEWKAFNTKYGVLTHRNETDAGLLFISTPLESLPAGSSLFRSIGTGENISVSNIQIGNNTRSTDGKIGEITLSHEFSLTATDRLIQHYYNPETRSMDVLEGVKTRMESNSAEHLSQYDFSSVAAFDWDQSIAATGTYREISNIDVPGLPEGENTYKEDIFTESELTVSCDLVNKRIESTSGDGAVLFDVDYIQVDTETTTLEFEDCKMFLNGVNSSLYTVSRGKTITTKRRTIETFAPDVYHSLPSLFYVDLYRFDRFEILFQFYLNYFGDYTHTKIEEVEFEDISEKQDRLTTGDLTLKFQYRDSINTIRTIDSFVYPTTVPSSSLAVGASIDFPILGSVWFAGISSQDFTIVQKRKKFKYNKTTRNRITEIDRNPNTTPIQYPVNIAQSYVDVVFYPESFWSNVPSEACVVYFNGSKIIKCEGTIEQVFAQDLPSNDLYYVSTRQLTRMRIKINTIKELDWHFLFRYPNSSGFGFVYSKNNLYCALDNYLIYDDPRKERINLVDNKIYISRIVDDYGINKKHEVHILEITPDGILDKGVKKYRLTKSALESESILQSDHISFYPPKR